MPMMGDHLVSVPESVITDIAALKQQQTDMRRSMDEANSRTAHQLALMDGRLESLSDLLQTVARIAERQESHSNGLDRAFVEIADVKGTINAHIAGSARWRESHTKDNEVVERKLTMWHGVAIGISLMSAALLAVFAWGGNEVLEGMREDVHQLREEARRTDQRLDRAEQILAQHHGADFAK